MAVSPPDGADLRACGDEDLMLAYAEGDAVAFDVLYARHKGGVHRYLLRQCDNAGTADELFQDIWMNLIRARGTYVPTAKFTTWLYRLAQHRLIDHWRTHGRMKLVADRAPADADGDDDDPMEAVPASRVDEPETRIGALQIRTHIDAALAALPAAQRDAFLLHQEAGLALCEIAELTGVGAETVKSRIRYALTALRSRLAHLRVEAR
jgi:RNA polymerase sigma-70 factor (ECF subfamily)